MRLGRNTTVIFDFDGTLVNSLPLHARAFASTLAAHRPDLAAGFDYDDWKGRETASVFRALGCDDAEAARLATAKRNAYEEAVQRRELEFMPGAAACLEVLEREGVRKVIATSGSRRSVEAAMAALDLGGRFDGLLTASEVANGKPAPDIFLETLKRFAIVPEEAVVVEDSVNGAMAARAAGLRVAGVYDAAVAPAADLFLPTLREFTDRFDWRVHGEA